MGLVIYKFIHDHKSYTNLVSRGACFTAKYVLPEASLKIIIRKYDSRQLAQPQSQATLENVCICDLLSLVNIK